MANIFANSDNLTRAERIDGWVDKGIRWDAAWNGENISVEPLVAGERCKMPEREGTCFFALCGNNAAEKQGDSLGSYLKKRPCCRIDLSGT